MADPAWTWLVITMKLLNPTPYVDFGNRSFWCYEKCAGSWTVLFCWFDVKTGNYPLGTIVGAVILRPWVCQKKSVFYSSLLLLWWQSIVIIGKKIYYAFLISFTKNISLDIQISFLSFFFCSFSCFFFPIPVESRDFKGAGSAICNLLLFLPNPNQKTSFRNHSLWFVVKTDLSKKKFVVKTVGLCLTFNVLVYIFC